MSPKVLIADDEAFIRLLIQQTLEDLEDQGVTLITADNGQDALRLVQEERPNLVFLDVMMPKMNGFEVCQKIKEAYGDEVYVVLLTAKGQEFDRQRGEQCGSNAYLTKPFDPDELETLAAQVLGVS